MASFRQYNIQLLPLDSAATEDVGIDGYRKLFHLLEEQVSSSLTKRTLDKTAFVLTNDTHFSPFYVHVEDDYAWGSFIKYHPASEVDDLYTARNLFRATAGTAAVSNQRDLPYLFAFKNHRLGIDEKSGQLPSNKQILKALSYFLAPIASDFFPRHVLKINLVAQEKALSDALSEAKGFRKVEVKLTFQNGPRIDAVLDEMRENNVHVVDVGASAEPGALMPNLPVWLDDFVRASTDYGEAFLSYVKENGKKAFFKTSDYPAKLALRLGKKEHWGDFLTRVYCKIVGISPPPKASAKKVIAKKVPRKRVIAKKAVTKKLPRR